MALHINLYNELQQQAEARRRDPAKLAALGGVLFFMLLVAYYAYRSSEVGALQAKLGGLQGEWARIEPQNTAAHAHEAELLLLQKNNQALVDRVQGRFYWATFLDRFSAAVPANVQIISFVGDFQKVEGPVSVVLSGIAAGAQARAVAEQFRTSLQQKLSKNYAGLTANFDSNSLEDGAAQAEINGQSLPTATFRIRLEFKPTPPVAEQTSPPAPKARVPKHS